MNDCDMHSIIIVLNTKRSQLYYNSLITNDVDHIITRAQFIGAVLASIALQRPKSINSLRSVIIKIRCHNR